MLFVKFDDAVDAETTKFGFYRMADFPKVTGYIEWLVSKSWLKAWINTNSEAEMGTTR